MKNKKIIVIGAGPGGLVASMLLAHRGFDVTILEKSDQIGGRNAELKIGEYSFDTGPTFLHQKFTLDEMFASVGRKSEDYMDFVKLDPMTKLTWGSTSLETSYNEKIMCHNIESVFPGESDGFRRFIKDHGHKMKAVYPCLQVPYHHLGTYFSSRILKILKYVITTKSVVDVLKKYFQDERLMLAFTFQAKYLGMNPWSCPGLFSILSYLEYKYGIYHIQGGLCKISHALAKVVEEEKGIIRLNTTVKEVVFKNKKKTKGVILQNGEYLEADDIVMNADYGHAMVNLMGQNNKSTHQIQKKKFSCSTFMIYLGLNKLYDTEPHHHILFSQNYQKNVTEITTEKIVSKDPSIYIRNSSLIDKTVAPKGHSQLYILVPTINTRHGYDWDTKQEFYKNLILDKIENQTTMKDLRKHIVTERCITPNNWANRDIFFGSTFNLAHTLNQMLYFRPGNRLKNYDNIYLVGGGTHPGSGLPTIFESARISTGMLCDKYKIKYKNVNMAPDFLK